MIYADRIYQKFCPNFLNFLCKSEGILSWNGPRGGGPFWTNCIVGGKQIVGWFWNWRKMADYFIQNANERFMEMIKKEKKERGGGEKAWKCNRTDKI